MNVNIITFRAVEKRNSIINPHFLNKKLNIKDIDYLKFQYFQDVEDGVVSYYMVSLIQ